MPNNQVTTPEEETQWSRAKEIVRDQYPDKSEEGDRFWKLVTHIFQNMKKSSTVSRLIRDHDVNE